MPNIFHQSVEDILKAATPEQRLLWNYVFLRWGERVAISQFLRIASTVGELGVYSANKLYLCYSLEISGSNGVPGAAGVTCAIYDETNTIFQYLRNVETEWDVTAAAFRYTPNNARTQNLYFSRLDLTGSAYSAVKFIGYRLSI